MNAISDPESIKPLFIVDTRNNAVSCLEAYNQLITRNIGYSYTLENFRAPLGIYNSSVASICEKLNHLCEHLEVYFHPSRTLQQAIKKHNEMEEEITNRIELLLHKATAHIDDIKNISLSFFNGNKRQMEKNRDYKKFQKNIKNNKWFVSSIVNNIKHDQNYIKLSALPFSHNNLFSCLLATHIEGVENGVVGINKKMNVVFSVTTLVWEVITFLLLCSQNLAQFIRAVNNQESHETHNSSLSVFSDAVFRVAQLPLYTFEERHPFSSRITLEIKYDNKIKETIKFALLGSIENHWPIGEREIDLLHDKYSCTFRGDGVTRKFIFRPPKTITRLIYTF